LVRSSNESSLKDIIGDKMIAIQEEITDLAQLKCYQKVAWRYFQIANQDSKILIGKKKYWEILRGVWNRYRENN